MPKPRWTEDIWKDVGPTVTLIRSHYRAYKLYDWTTNRVAALANLMNVTPYEICALAGVTEKERVKHLWDRGKKGGKPWPPEIALHFARLEKFVHEEVFHEKQVPNFHDCLIARVLDRIDKAA